MEVCVIDCIASSLKLWRTASDRHPFKAWLFKGSSKSGSYHSRCLSHSFSNLHLVEDSKFSEKVVLESNSEEGDSCEEILKKYKGDSTVPRKSRSFQLETENYDADAKFNERLCENEQFSVDEEEAVSVSVLSNSSLASQHQRAKPRNPRFDIGKSTLADVAKKEGSRSDPLFTTEEKAYLKMSRPDLSKINSEKWPLLHTLVTSGQEVYLDRFLKQGAEVNTVDKDGYSALQRAVLAKKQTAVNLLLGAGADVTVCDKDGASLLHYSVQTGSMSFVRLFVNRGVDINSVDKYGWTPLHLAVLSGRADVVRLLLVSGADKTLSNKDGFTPLDLSLTLGRGFNSCEVAKGLKTLPKKQASIDIC